MKYRDFSPTTVDIDFAHPAPIPHSYARVIAGFLTLVGMLTWTFLFIGLT